MLALVLSACAGQQLKAHALVALASSQLIDEVGEAIEVEASEDYLAAGGVHAEPEELAMLRATYEPLRQDNNQVRAAHADYVRAIAEADARGDKTLVQKPARTLLALWSRLGTIAEQLGIEVPPVPDALRKLAGDQ